MEDKKSTLPQQSTTSLLEKALANRNNPDNAIIKELFNRKFETEEQAQQIINLGKELAGEGNAEAQFQLGRCIETNKVVFADDPADDSNEMMRLYKLAADQGLADAQYSWGLNQCCWGSQENREEGLRMCLLAALQGHIEAWQALSDLGRSRKGLAEVAYKLAEKIVFEKRLTKCEQDKQLLGEQLKILQENFDRYLPKESKKIAAVEEDINQMWFTTKDTFFNSQQPTDQKLVIQSTEESVQKKESMVSSLSKLNLTE